MPTLCHGRTNECWYQSYEATCSLGTNSTTDDNDYQSTTKAVLTFVVCAQTHPTDNDDHPLCKPASIDEEGKFPLDNDEWVTPPVCGASEMAKKSCRILIAAYRYGRPLSATLAHSKWTPVDDFTPCNAKTAALSHGDGPFGESDNVPGKKTVGEGAKDKNSVTSDILLHENSRCPATEHVDGAAVVLLDAELKAPETVCVSGKLTSEHQLFEVVDPPDNHN